MYLMCTHTNPFYSSSHLKGMIYNKELNKNSLSFLPKQFLVSRVAGLGLSLTFVWGFLNNKYPNFVCRYVNEINKLQF